MKITDSPTFCPYPWISVRVSVNGGVGICSYSKDIGSTQDTPMDQIINGPLLTEIKQTMASGQWHTNCGYCRQSESKGGRSERQTAINWLHQLPAQYADTINDNPSGFVLTHAIIGLSNLCNLSCNYCGPEVSTKWQEKLGIPLQVNQVSNTSAEWLVKNSKNLISVDLGGGEPLLQKQINDLLLQLNNTSLSLFVATNLSVELETNPMFNTIKNNPKLNTVWSISFDGIGDKFEYVRSGAEWKQFRKNIDTLKKYNQQIEAHPVYGLYSAFDLVEYVDFCVNNDVRIHWSDIFNPPELDIRYAPKQLRDLAVQNIDDVLAKHENKTLLNLDLDTLKKYRAMAVSGNHFLDYRSVDSDKLKALKILKFNDKIETQLSKNKTFADLWPNIYSILVQETQK